MARPTVRYSQNYERTSELRRDSERMRRRLLRVLIEYMDGQNFSIKLARHVERECGIDVVRTGSYPPYPDWDMLFLSGELRDVFDTLTFAVRGIPDRIVKDRITPTVESSP